MQLIKAYNKITTLPNNIFTTQDISILLGISNKHGNQILLRLAAENLIMHLRRGLWAIKNSFDPLMLPEYLTAPFPSYISLQTALYFHGIISQVPANIYAISIARTRNYDTPAGFFSIHHMQPNLFSGFAVAHENNIKIATPEKALFDFLYLKSAKSKLFYSLPEVEFPKNFNWKQMTSFCEKINNRSRKQMVLMAIEQYQ